MLCVCVVDVVFSVRLHLPSTVKSARKKTPPNDNCPMERRDTT